MRTKIRKPDYGAIARNSVRNDMRKVKEYTNEEKRPQIEDFPQIGDTRRIICVNENSGYFKLRSYLLGRLVRLVERSPIGCSWYCEFVRDEDREAINAAAGWSNRKDRYLLDGVKFKEI